MWPSSWDCVSPHTCVRCARSNIAEDDTCVFNKFICLCDEGNIDKDGRRVPCLHQEIIDEHKNKLAEQRNSLPSFSGGASNITNKVKRKPKRRKKKTRQHEHSRRSDIFTREDYLLETKRLLPDNQPTPTQETPDEDFEPESRLKANACSNFSNENSCSSISSSSDSSSSSSSCSSSSTSSSSSSDSSSSSSCSSSSATEDSCNDECSQSEVTRRASRRGYKMMGDSDGKVNDCDKSDNVISGESDSESSGDSTSVSSDDSWWRKYEQLKEMPFLHEKSDSTKDSGYVSTTSPNTESAKTDE